MLKCYAALASLIHSWLFLCCRRVVQCCNWMSWQQWERI